MNLCLSWTNLKNLITTKDLVSRLQYVEDEVAIKGTIYNIWFEESLVVYTCRINDQDNASDVTDFENNYKSNANQAIEQTSDDGIKKVAVVPAPKTTYKCQVKSVTDSWQEYDLSGTYSEFTIMNNGNQDIVVKLNDSANDEIPLSGGGNIRDIIGSDSFAVTKVYYKTAEAEKTSQLFIWVTK